MGLQGQLNDVAAGSIFLHLVALLASCLYRLRGLLVSSESNAPPGRWSPSEQLSLNRILSYTFSSDHSPVSDCVFCLSAVNDRDRVRALSCCHVFHKCCFDGWIRHMNFSCPLCRSPFTNFSPPMLPSF